MRGGLLITVRTGSSRLPRKVLKKIDDRRVIDILIDRCQEFKGILDTVICTTDKLEDNIIEEIGVSRGVKVFRGSNNNLIARWYQAAIKNNLDFLINIDGDDLLFSKALIRDAIEKIKTTDFVTIEHEKEVVCGCFTFGIKTKTLEKIYKSNRKKGLEETQYMWLDFKNNNDIRKSYVDIPDELLRPEIRATLDYEEDLKFFKEVFKKFKTQKLESSTTNLVKVIDSQPSLLTINRNKHKDYLNNQKRGLINEKTKTDL